MTDPEPLPQPYGQRHDDLLREVGLTEMEERILDALAHGKTGQEICRDLGISRREYHRYLEALRRYLAVRTTTEAVALYARLKSGSNSSGNP